tara:strand:+ start:76 stop:513 length:438 start_codon:yes stop_codon:yes gene_type:complete
MERGDSSMVLLAIFVSRFEASIIAEMLRGYCLHVNIDAEAHGSVEYISLAFGGHRLRVFREDYRVASDILRQAGVGEEISELPGPSRALVWLVGTLGCLYSVLLGSAVITGSAPIAALLYIPLGVYSLPVDPKGRSDYFLADDSQ